MTVSLDESRMVGALKIVHFHLTPFNPDQINMIKLVFPETGLKTPIFALLSDLRIELITNADEQLTQQYREIKTAFIEHIFMRIAVLDVPSPSLAGRTVTPDIPPRLRQASFHLQDLLFTINTIIHHRVERFSSACVEELRTFRKIHLMNYLSLFPNATKLAKYLRKMENALKINDFDRAAKAHRKFKPC
ncbi:MAG: hypothetical protein LLG04_11940 [Parachlamydia sp.]|nr:hypothetical protein [Parachlamydia sp.]